MVKLCVDDLLIKQKKSRYWLFNEMNNIKPISYTNFNNLISQKNQSIKYESLENLCKILKCNISDILIITKS